MQFCPACGHQNPDVVDVCLSCAADLGRRCPGCRQLSPVEARFCSQCGARLTDESSASAARPSFEQVAQSLRELMPATLAQKISAAAVEIVGERREVTVLFADVVGFTSVANTLDSEDAYFLMDDALHVMADVIHKYEGTIDKFTGDGLLALFGAPVAHENDPERAVRAALELQSALRSVQERTKNHYGFDFRIRVGINTGLVIAGQVGSDCHLEYTVIGDTVNLASRLETAAEPGTILVSMSTYQRTRPFFEFESLPSVAVKGLADPIPVFRPLHPRDEPGSARGLPGLFVPMVGRKNELDRMKNTLASILTQHRSRVLLVTGEAGLGKSRLVDEFRRICDRSECCFYQSDCRDYTQSTPQWAAAQLLRSILNVSELDQPAVQRRALEIYLDRVVTVSDQSLPYLATLLGLPQADPLVESRMQLMDASALQRQTHAALRQILLAEADQAPTVVVFEDLHWVDPASREFLEYLLQTLEHVPLLLILVSRPSVRDTLRELLDAADTQDQGWVTEIALQPLSAADGQFLIDHLLQRWTANTQALKQYLAERAEGNPFYAEEMVRMLIDHEDLVGEPGTWEINRPIDELLKEVPGTVRGLILARFDRLSPDLRRTLQSAAVVGRSFPVMLLQSLDAQTPAAVAAQLAELEARQFLVSEPFGTQPGYAFRHNLIQESVYGILLRRDRREIHLQVAQAIDRGAFLPPNEEAERLAFHYIRSSEPQRAIPFLSAAAATAAQRGANETAIQHYREALRLMEERPEPDCEQLFRARFGLGRALKYVGQFTEAGVTLWRALQDLLHWSVSGDNATVLTFAVQGFTDLADVRLREGAYDEAIGHLEAGFEALGPTGAEEQPHLRRTLVDRLAWVLFRQGKLDEAYTQASTAVADVNPERLDDPMTLANLYNTLGGIYWQRGDLPGATIFVQRSFDLYQQLGDTWGMANAYTNLGALFYIQGMWRRAAEFLEQADSLRRDNGYMSARALGLKNLGLLRLALGDHVQAQQDLETSLAISRRLGDNFGVVLAEIGLAALAVKRSRMQEAAVHLDAARAHLDAAGEDQVIQVGWLTALVQADQGDFEDGLVTLEKVLERARESKLWEEEADCLRVLGRIHVQSRLHTQAEKFLQMSLDLSQHQCDSYREGQALFELGCLYLQQAGEQKERQSLAQTRLRSAADKFASLGAAYDLAQTQDALAQM